MIHGLVLCDTSPYIAEVRLGSICLGGCHMTNDLTAIKRDPIEGRMREVVDVVPAELLSEESRHTSQSANLRKLSRVAKRIRKPEGCASFTKSALEETLTIDELTDQRLSAGHVGIMLDPGSTYGLEGTLLDFALNAVKNRGIQLLQPLELLGLRCNETVLRVLLQQVTLIGP